MKIINLISGPRNLSTALMYSFAKRSDMVVLDEPFYGYYLKNAALTVKHPSQEEVLQTMETEEDKIVDSIQELSKKKHVFVKGMAHHYLSENPKYILDWENVLLIRHPKKLIASFAKVIENPGLENIGLKKSSELFTYLKNNGKTPVVIDSDELLKNPETYLRKLCAALHIDFSEKMLSWKKGGIPEDGIWAKHWYKNVHNSEGFAVQKTSSREFPEYLKPVLEQAMPYYEILRNNILKND